MFEVLGDDRVFLNHGPLQIMLKADRCGRGMREELQEAAIYAVAMLEELAQVLPLAKDRQTVVHPNPETLPLTLRLMIEGVRAAEDEELTPMAAVAGTFSDLIADRLLEWGATKVLINNGGDIAIRLLSGQETKVGLTPSIESPGYSHVLHLTAEDGIGGITTSGLGGRSFSQGIANAVTVLAENARIADACATMIANHCYVEDPAIIRVPAERLDPNTDIKGLPVTVRVENLRPETVAQAMTNGLKKAADFYTRGIIRGVAIFMGTEVVMIPEDLAKKI